MPKTDIKFVAISDVHLTDKCGGRAEEDILKVIITKLVYVKRFARKHGASAILCTGDLFDRDIVSLNVVRETVLWLQDCQKSGFDKLLTVIGNHDVLRGNPEMLSSSVLGLLVELGLVHCIMPDSPLSFTENIKIWGFPHGSRSTEYLLSGKLTVPNDAVNIGLIHAPIADYESPYSYDVRRQKLKGLDVAVFGDIHDGFAPIKVGKCIAVNPGALVRKTRDEMDRKPMCVLITVSLPSRKIQVTRHVIPHNPAHEAFPIATISKEHREAFTGFVAMLEAARDVTDEPPKERVMRIGKSAGYPTAVIDYVIENLWRI